MSDTLNAALPVRQAPPDPLPQIIPYASVNLLAGASGVGKTCLTAWLAKQFRDQLPIFGWQPNPLAKIAYLCMDRGWSSTRVWLERVGYPDIPFYSLTDDADFDANKLHNKRARIVIFRDCLMKLKLVPNSLVIVDPIALFMGGNLNDYDTCAVALIGIRKICQEFGVTILGLSHASKQKTDRAEQYKRLQDRILGSAAQHGYGDTQMYLASPDECNTKYYQFLVHPHLCKPVVIHLERDDQGLFIPYNSAGPAQQVPAMSSEDSLPSHAVSVVVSSTPELDAQIDADPNIIAVYELIQDTDPGTTTGEILTLAKASIGISRATTFRVINLMAQARWIVSLGRGRWKRTLPLRVRRALGKRET